MIWDSTKKTWSKRIGNKRETVHCNALALDKKDWTKNRSMAKAEQFFLAMMRQVPTYAIERYEVHISTYHIRANSMAEAIRELENSYCSRVSITNIHLGCSEDIESGISVNQFSEEEAQQMKKLGLFEDGILRSIASIKMVG